MNGDTIPRLLGARLEEYLRIFPAVALLGPRQVGKTTLARAIAGSGGGRRTGKPGLYLDLENPADQEKLADARGYLGARGGRLVVLDEIHRAPRLFQVLRGIIDERIHGGEPVGQFLLLGSASVDLLQQSGESLAGRIGYLELAPLDVRELDRAARTRLWLRGGFPRAFLAPDDTASALWRESFIRTYLERDVPAFGPRAPPRPSAGSGPCSHTRRAGSGTPPRSRGALRWTARPWPGTSISSPTSSSSAGCRRFTPTSANGW